MKTRCSSILKAALALALAFVLLFGTVATGTAALVKDLASVGDDPVFTVYFTPNSSWTGSYTHFGARYDQRGDGEGWWESTEGYNTNKTIGGNVVYQVDLPLVYSGLSYLYFKAYTSSADVISDTGADSTVITVYGERNWHDAASTFSDKYWNGSSWIDPVWDGPSLNDVSADATHLYTTYTGADAYTDYKTFATVSVDSNISTQGGTITATVSSGSSVSISNKNLAVDSGSFRVNAVSVGTSTVTVTYTASDGSNVVGSENITFTVSEYDPYNYIYLTNNHGWDNGSWSDGVYIYFFKNDAALDGGAWPGFKMKKVMTNNDSPSHSVYLYKILKRIDFDGFLFNANTSDNNQSHNVSITRDAYIAQTIAADPKNAYYLGDRSGDPNSYSWGTWNVPFSKPTSVSVSNVSVGSGETATATATVSDSTAGVYFVSASTAVATVTAKDDDSTGGYTSTVTGVTNGSTSLTAYAYPAQPGNITSFEWNADVAAMIGRPSTPATITVTDTSRTVTINQKAKNSSSASFSDVSASEGSVAVSYTNTSNVSSSTTVTSSGSVTAKNSTEVTLTATANTEYRFLGWDTDNNGTIDNTASNVYTISAESLTENKTVTAYYGAGVMVTFNDSADFSSAELKAATFCYNGDRPVAPAFTDHSAYGYTDGKWSSNSGTDQYTSATLPLVNSLTSNSDITYVAYYTKATYSITIKEYVSNDKSDTADSLDPSHFVENTSGVQIGSYSGNVGPFSYTGSTAATTTITNDSYNVVRYVFLGFYDSTSATSTTSVTGISVEGNRTIYARYREKTYSLVGQFNGESFNADHDFTYNTTDSDGTYLATISLPANQTYEFKVRENHNYDGYVNGGVNITGTITDASGWGMSNSNATIHTTYSGDYIFKINPTSHKIWVTYPTRNVSFVRVDNVSGNPAPDEAYTTGTAYSAGDTWNLVAVPGYTYTFNGWTYTVGGVANAPGVTIAEPSSLSTTAVVTTTDAVVITANFSKIPDRSVTISAVGTDDGGTTYNVDLAVSTITTQVGEGGAAAYTSAVTGIANGSAVTLTAPELIVDASSSNTYRFVDWYDTTNSTQVTTDSVKSFEHLVSNLNYQARYERLYETSFYRSFVYDTNIDDLVMKASAPTLYSIDGGSTWNTYTNGQKIKVSYNTTVKYSFTALASSDLINEVRYDNNPSFSYDDAPDKANFTYRPGETGTLYYPGAIGITGGSLASIYDATNQVISFTMTGDYKNCSLILGTKKRLIFNNGSSAGINFADNNPENYYAPGETVGKTSEDNNTDGFRVYLDNTTDSTCHYVFTNFASAVTFKDDSGNDYNTGRLEDEQIKIKAYNTSNTEESTSAADIIYYIFYCEKMPSDTDIHVTIGVQKQYTMRLSNIVISDNTGNKTMLTEASSSDTVSPTGYIGTISAKVGETHIDNDGVNGTGYYFTHHDYNSSSSVTAYDNSTNNVFLHTGVNKLGTNINAGETVTYKFEFADGKDAEYSFVGWFEGSLNGDAFFPNYRKKLSDKLTFNYTPTKNTVIMAVGTRNVYLGGSFDTSGAYTATAADQTWTANRLPMQFDPTYVNNTDSSKKGRYYCDITATPNTQYEFSVYDAVSGTKTTDRTTWEQWNNGSGDAYSSIEDGIAFSRYKSDHEKVATFMYTDAADQSFTKHDGTTTTIGTSHLANQYINPVRVYFYAYDGGISVQSSYKWPTAYVSAGRGIDVTGAVYKKDGSPDVTYNGTTDIGNPSFDGPGDGYTYGYSTYNEPTVTVAASTAAYGGTAGGQTVDTTSVTVGESVIKANPHQDDGYITVIVDPQDKFVELQGFVVYNINTKTSTAVVDSATSTRITKTSKDSGADPETYVEGTTTEASFHEYTYSAAIQIPKGSQLYIVPVYKFKDVYVEFAGLEDHRVNVRTSDIDNDKDVWGGLVGMFSWGTNKHFSSGGWPGQVLLPADDGSFYGQLTFFKNGLAGVTINNYRTNSNFIGCYESSNISDTPYSGSGSKAYQSYDYREPISIIENLNEGLYTDDDLTLTFALKEGNKASDGFGNGAYAKATSWEYLTDANGNHVDLNGDIIESSSGVSYYIVCKYTQDYRDGGTKTYGFYYDKNDDGVVDRDGRTTHNTHSIEWYVYNSSGTAVLSGNGYLSAAFADKYPNSLSYIAKALTDASLPYAKREVCVAYENPYDNGSEIRYSGQWYTASNNTLISCKVRVGAVNGDEYTIEPDNTAGYGTATASIIGLTPGETKSGEEAVTETSDNPSASFTPYSKVTLITKHATDGHAQLTVNTTTDFQGWYTYSDGVYTHYSDAQTITVSYTSEVTYYAIYAASASYQFRYYDRNGNLKTYSVKGTYDLTPEELAAGGTLDPTVDARRSDIESKLSGLDSALNVFNHTYTLSLSDFAVDLTTPYTAIYTIKNSDEDNQTKYNLRVWGYNGTDTLVLITTLNSKVFNATVDLNTLDIPSPATVRPASNPTARFIGWYEYNEATGSPFGNVISTHANFGFSVTKSMSIAPVFGAPLNVTGDIDSNWHAYVDDTAVSKELTAPSTGVLYNDNIIRFRWGEDSATQLNLEEHDSGIVIFAQTAAGKESYSDAFEDYTTTQMTNAMKNLKTAGRTSGKVSATDTYVFYIPTRQLSRLNRVDIVHMLDYARFSGGQYKVMAYTEVSENTYVVSEAVRNDY